MKAHDFSLPDQDGTIHSLDQYTGKWVVVYFYPKDDTPGCTKEACGFRDLSETFQKLGVVILGISKDSIASHKKFAEKYNLNFPLLSDQSKETIVKYNSWGLKKFMGREFMGILRMTYLVNPSGEIQKVYQNVNPLSHPQEIISDVKMYLDS